MVLGELPAGWEKAELSEICLVNPTIDKSAIADDLAVSFVPMPAVEAENGAVDVSATRKFGDVKKGYTPFREGDVLFAKITPCMENGKMAVVPVLHNGLGFGSTEFHVLRAHPGISPQFVYHFVSSRSFRHVAEHNMSGAVGQRRVTTPYLSACTIPVPPTAEQHRIVAKIEELFSELDQGVASLKTAREQLKVYRQSLLKNAFEGKLTAAWRAAHRDQLESATALQQRIARERQARYQQQLADWQAAGQSGPKPKPPKPLPPLTAEEVAELPELPVGWGWVRLEALISRVDQGWSPKCDGRRVDENEWAVIKTTAIQHGRFDEFENKALPPGLEPRTQHELQPGDILVTRAGPRIRVGVCCLVRSVKPKLMNCDKAYRIRALSSLCSAQFLESVLNSPRVLDVLERIKSGINDSGVNLNQGAFLGLAIPFCGLTEQQAVVDELESKLSEADQLDQTLATALQQADALRQSILKKAFCGQLVAQDPNDEPATALLERIRAGKSNGMSTPRNRRKSG